jgi:antitoxin HigA-1
MNAAEGGQPMLPKNRAPTLPGEILEKEFLEPMGISQTALAEKIDRHVQVINAIVNGRRAITAETAWLLAGALKTTPEFWMNLQTAWDLWNARRKMIAQEHA